MSARNDPTYKAIRREQRTQRKAAFRERYAIMALSFCMAGATVAPNRAERRGNVTHTGRRFS